MTVILGALDGELTALIAALGDARHVTWHGVPVHTGTLSAADGGARESVVIARTGVGKVQAALLAQRLIDRYEPNRVVMVGVAGSLREDLHVGDVVVAEATVQHDMDVTGLGFAPGAIPYTDYHVIPCDRALIDAALATLPEAGEQLLGGLVISGDQFIDDHEVKHRLAEVHQAACVEMEGAAVGLVARVNDLPFLLLRIISDQADGKAANFEEVLGLAATRAWHYLSQMIPFPEEPHVSSSAQ